jgi:hypothetical protein
MASCCCWQKKPCPIIATLVSFLLIPILLSSSASATGGGGNGSTTAQVLLRSGEEQLRFQQMKAQLARVREASVKTIQVCLTHSSFLTLQHFCQTIDLAAAVVSSSADHFAES